MSPKSTVGPRRTISHDRRRDARARRSRRATRTLSCANSRCTTSQCHGGRACRAMRTVRGCPSRCRRCLQQQQQQCMGARTAQGRAALRRLLKLIRPLTRRFSQRPSPAGFSAGTARMASWASRTSACTVRLSFNFAAFCARRPFSRRLPFRGNPVGLFSTSSSQRATALPLRARVLAPTPPPSKRPRRASRVPAACLNYP